MTQVVNINNDRPRQRRKYGCCHFLFDVTMCVITGGLWLIWIFCREMRNA